MGIVALVGGAIGSILTYLASRGKDQTQLVLDERQADRQSIITLEQRYEREISRLTGELTRMAEAKDREIARLMGQVQVMTVDRDQWLNRFLEAIQLAEASTGYAEESQARVPR